MPLIRTVDPTSEPVTVADAKLHMRVDTGDTSQDKVIERALLSATAHVEKFTGLSLIQQTWRLSLAKFTDPEGGPDSRVIELPKPPLQTVTSVAYTDTAGASQTFSSASYTVITDSKPGVIELGFSADWPETRSVLEAVVITYVTGYTAANSIPDDIIQAILLQTTALMSNRGDAAGDVAEAFERLLWPHRLEIAA